MRTGTAGYGKARCRRRETHLERFVEGADADDVGLGEPPEADKVVDAGEVADVADKVVEGAALLVLEEAERGLDVEGDVEDEAGAADAADGGHEEVVALLAGAADAGAVCEEEGEGADVHGEHGLVEAGAMGGGRDDTAEGLVGDGAEVDHGEAMLCEGGVEGVEGDAGLGDDITLVDIDLQAAVS